MARPKVYVFDLDGTIADISHRLHFVKGKPKNWPAFFDACDGDSPVEWIVGLMKALDEGVLLEEDTILILSGRSNAVRGKTERWLKKHGVPYDQLLMRPEANYRPDEELKLDMLMMWLNSNELYAEDVKFIVDDRQKVVDMWRANGFNVLQCAAWEEDDVKN